MVPPSPAAGVAGAGEGDEGKGFKDLGRGGGDGSRGLRLVAGAEEVGEGGRRGSIRLFKMPVSKPSAYVVETDANLSIKIKLSAPISVG